MQVANALNNNIRILFNPKVEAFKLFDFLIVKSESDRYLAQIIEIYDDKFDASQNVAKLKLFYKISPQNEVMAYDNFTPNKECEIVKINQHEIENFINQDKKVFEIGLNAKDSTPLNIQYGFFDNNPVILADKIEASNSIFISLAKKLSTERHAVVIDATGTIEYDYAKKIRASKNFKLPLNYSTIDYIFDKCLENSTLEFQAIGAEILNEIKKFAKKQPLGFIPYTVFINVLIEQYKATPYPELRLLVSRLKKYQMDEIFARSKKDIECLLKTIEKHELTIIDISPVSMLWQKAYLEHIVNSIEQDCYVIARLNDDNFDIDLINYIYNSKKNIKFVPSVSYSYKKLPSIMQYCKNYILMPSLHQRTDFLDANFALCNLISQGCIIFGENTDNFLYIAKNYELEVEEKKINYRKISLSQTSNNQEGYVQDFMHITGRHQDTELPEQRAIEELSELQKTQEDAFIQSEGETSEVSIIQDVQKDSNVEVTIDTIELENEIEAEQAQLIEEADVAKNSDNNLADEPVQDDTQQQEIQELETIDNTKINHQDVELIELEQDVQSNEVSQEENNNQGESFEEIIKEEIQQEQNEVVQEEKETPSEDKYSLNDDNLVLEEDKIEGDINFSDEELDFFEMSKDNPQEKKEENTKNTDLQDNEIDLNEIANNSINDNFEEIINQKKETSDSGVLVDENVRIDFNKASDLEDKQDLPIFVEPSDDNQDNTNSNINNLQTYKTGDTVNHAKYGTGTIVKIIGYEDRQLLQIRFESSGPKLLDPKVANIEIVQES